MRAAWAARREAFDQPEAQQRESFARARDDLGRAVELCRQGDDPVELAHSLHLLANLERDLHRHEAALPLWLEAVAILRETDDPLQLAHKIRGFVRLQYSNYRYPYVSPEFDRKRHDDIWEPEIGAWYQIQPWLKLEARYRLRDRASNWPEKDYRNNRFFLELSAIY